MPAERSVMRKIKRGSAPQIWIYRCARSGHYHILGIIDDFYCALQRAENHLGHLDQRHESVQRRRKRPTNRREAVTPRR
jgi:hypothetical protein